MLPAADRRAPAPAPAPTPSWPAKDAAWPPLTDPRGPPPPAAAAPPRGAWRTAPTSTTGVRLVPGADWPPRPPLPRPGAGACSRAAVLDRAPSAPVPLSPRASVHTPATFDPPLAPPHSPERLRAPRPRRPAPARRPRAARGLAGELAAAAGAGGDGALPPGAARGRLAVAALAPPLALEEGDVTLDDALAAAAAAGCGSTPLLTLRGVALVVAGAAADLATLHAAGALHRRVRGASVVLSVSTDPSSARLAPPPDGGARLPPRGGAVALIDAKTCGGRHPAPEVARARVDRVAYTRAGDVWALGATAAAALVAVAAPPSAAAAPPLCTHPAALLAAAQGGATVDALQAWLDGALAKALAPCCVGGGDANADEDAAAAAAPLVDLVASMLRVDPGQRPTAAAVAARAAALANGGGCGGDNAMTPCAAASHPTTPVPELDGDTLDALARLWPAAGRGRGRAAGGSAAPRFGRRAGSGRRGTGGGATAAEDGPLGWLSRLVTRQPRGGDVSVCK